MHVPLLLDRRDGREGLPIDDSSAVLHLDGVAGKPDEPFYVRGFWSIGFFSGG